MWHQITTTKHQKNVKQPNVTQQTKHEKCESRARSNSDMEIPETSKHKENITTQRKHKEHTTSLNCIENIHGTKKHQNTNANSKKTQPSAHIPSHKISRASRRSGSRSVGLQASRASDQSGTYMRHMKIWWHMKVWRHMKIWRHMTKAGLVGCSL